MYSIYKERIEATYTCGLYGMFQGPGGDKYEELTSVCGWNKSWVPEVSVIQYKLSCHFIITLKVFDPCVATSCQYIPFPPSDLDMVYVPDDQNYY